MKQLSVIILTYNSEKDIYQCLESVYQYNDIGEDLEVIVVDNQSTHFAAMQQEIAHRYPEVIITQNTRNCYLRLPPVCLFIDQHLTDRKSVV